MQREKGCPKLVTTSRSRTTWLLIRVRVSSLSYCSALSAVVLPGRIKAATQPAAFKFILQPTHPHTLRAREQH